MPARRAVARQLVATPPPSAPIYRVARLGSGPFGPTPWAYVGANRFDDPDGVFRVVYCASEAAGAFGETLAGYRRSLSLLTLMRAVVDDDEPLEQAVLGLLDPTDERRGVVPADWRFKRQLASTVLEPSLAFADITAAESVAVLRDELAAVASAHRLDDFDLSTVLSSGRE